VIVLDASATLDGFCNAELWPKLIEIVRINTTLVPMHYAIECLSALRRIDRAHLITPQQFATLHHFIEKTPLHIIPTVSLSQTIWEKRHNLSAYDANYLAIAEAYQATLVTHDLGLAKSAEKTVHVLRLDD
jgi:predicted nucleic acid-binding protein